MNQNWFRRRWFDFRQGHAVYLIFLLTFANFVLIFHRLLIERIEFLDQVFSELWVFALFFVLIYIPLAILIGAWHRKTQIKIENEVILRQNPLWAKMFRTLIDIELKQISKEELDETRQLLDRIEKGKGQ
ncbi:MAG: hypothetical protein OEM28_05900 [Nitrosopumilus sp.]|nr:hypothetical protein [Nitrosopumilus sp.]